MSILLNTHKASPLASKPTHADSTKVVIHSQPKTAFKPMFFTGPQQVQGRELPITIHRQPVLPLQQSPTRVDSSLSTDSDSSGSSRSVLLSRISSDEEVLKRKESQPSLIKADMPACIKKLGIVNALGLNLLRVVNRSPGIDLEKAKKTQLRTLEDFPLAELSEGRLIMKFSPKLGQFAHDLMTAIKDEYGGSSVQAEIATSPEGEELFVSLIISKPVIFTHFLQNYCGMTSKDFLLFVNQFPLYGKAQSDVLEAFMCWRHLKES